MISNIVITGKLSDVKLSAVKGIYQCECTLVVHSTDVKIRTRFRYHPKDGAYADGDNVVVSGYLVPYLDGSKETLAIRASQAAKICGPEGKINIVTLVGVIQHGKLLVRNFGRTFEISVVGALPCTGSVHQATTMITGNLVVMESGDLGIYCCDGGGE